MKLALGLATIFAVAGCHNQPQQAATPASAIGRYQMVKGEDLHAVFVLDTVTGDIAACNEDLGYHTWCASPANAGTGKGPSFTQSRP